MSIEKLREETNEFFKRHWQEPLGVPPNWSEPWRFVGSIQYANNPGCYALFSDEKLLYIGVAESDLARRTNAYTRKSLTRTLVENREYEAESKWKAKNLNCIYTIGFTNKDFWYLSASLEKYLIRKLRPPENVNGK